MTRRDYILIADVVARTLRSDESRRAIVALEFADALSGTNPRFDRRRFIEAATKA